MSASRSYHMFPLRRRIPLLCSKHIGTISRTAPIRWTPCTSSTNPIRPISTSFPFSQQRSPELPHALVVPGSGSDDNKSPLDNLIHHSVQSLLEGIEPDGLNTLVDLRSLWNQYANNSGKILDEVLAYEEHPSITRRADRSGVMDHISSELEQTSWETPQSPGILDEKESGLVLLVHVLLKPQKESSLTNKLSANKDWEIEKLTLCSGFEIDPEPLVRGEESELEGGRTIVSCAHTLEEMFRYMRSSSTSSTPSISSSSPSEHTQAKQALAVGQRSFSFILTSTGRPIMIESILSSLPRSDLIILRTVPPSNLDLPPLIPSRSKQGEADPVKNRARGLPVTPYPMRRGEGVLMHLFGEDDIPKVSNGKHVLRDPAQNLEGKGNDRDAKRWMRGTAWTRWGRGEMLGYRSYTGLEVEAGTSNRLSHILTSILPTHGSSGGPIISEQTGAVVGVVSGRRMDNRVEGERGWGAGAEGIFEMFSLPGFVPASKRR